MTYFCNNCTLVCQTSAIDGGQQRIQVAKYHQHPKFTGEYDYDIMLLELN